jgi:hypothetical protein
MSPRKAIHGPAKPGGNLLTLAQVLGELEVPKSTFFRLAENGDQR